jgi:hypothetical protein
MSRLRRVAAGVALVIAGVTIPAGVASAGPGGTKGPGDCEEAVGKEVLSIVAKFPGPNAGPKRTDLPRWGTPPAPNAPGQEIKETCLS